MNKVKISLGVMLIALAVLLGCSPSVQPLKPVELPPGGEVEVTPVVPEESAEAGSGNSVVREELAREDVEMEHTLSVIPAYEESGEELPVEGEAILSDSPIAFRPAYFEINGVKAGDTVDTWTSNGYFDVGGVRVEYKKGEHIFFLLYNGSDSVSTYVLSVENAPGEVGYLRSGSKPDVPLYRAPDAFLPYVSVPKEVSVRPHRVYKVPFGFVVPEGEYPDSWEFRIRISDPKSRRGNIVVEYALRVAVYGQCS